MSTPPDNNLNLARKLRPQTFNKIIGQEIPVRMLKNSLFLKKFFPVYLFAGQRGCGKTSTARVFAASVNCNNLNVFQEKPTEQALPCSSCESCNAMKANNHPDFIEMDAASHTGVDNVRQIIETASYVPLMGQKKIYLIDEAHMLSKAAFNAFLKILEEPPETVLFMLATTELKKIPETVLSRCFQLTFNPINFDHLKNFLKDVCEQENILIDAASIDLLIEETDGSARDALNLLEQVRFSSENIDEESLLRVLGKVSTSSIITLFNHLVDQKPDVILEYLTTINFASLVPQSVWHMMVELCRALLWVKYGVTKVPNSFRNNLDELKILAQKCSLNRLHAIMQLMWSQESLFQQTDKKHTFLELVLLQLCHQTDIADLESLLRKTSQGSHAHAPPITPKSTPTPSSNFQVMPPPTPATIAQTAPQKYSHATNDTTTSKPSAKCSME